MGDEQLMNEALEALKLMLGWPSRKKNVRARAIVAKLEERLSKECIKCDKDGDEVGCQINLITGEHYGPCKGSCKPEKDPLQALSEYLESEVHHWETDPQSDFRDGVVSGYRWAKWKLDGVIKNSESN